MGRRGDHPAIDPACAIAIEFVTQRVEHAFGKLGRFADDPRP